MSQKSIILVVSLFVLLIAGMFIFADLKQTELNEERLLVPDTVVPTDDVSYPNIERIDAKHYFIDGLHTLVGELIMPTPCDLVETSALVAESYPEQVTVNFTVINNTEVCVQVETAYRFKVAFSASQEASINAVFMGRAVELNLIPALEGEKPEEFELFIKG